jgi:hypothetical protein
MTHIVFFNAFHNGDVHVSRGFVRQIMSKVKQLHGDTVFSYSHRNPSNLLADIEGLHYNPHLINQVGSEHNNLVRLGDMVFINTWYAQQRWKYMNRYGITFDTLYAAFDDTCKSIWNFSLEDISQNPSDFFPVIDYDKFHIGPAQQWLAGHPEKKILVENGLAKSDQATNFPLVPVIVKAAQRHPEMTFILTEKDGANLPPNVVYSHNIIRKSERSDLNETSFLSSQCDLIIGRSSGVFSFCLTQDNLFRRKIKYLCFSNLTPTHDNKYWLGSLMTDKINYNSHILNVNESNPDRAFNLIEEHL